MTTHDTEDTTMTISRDESWETWNAFQWTEQEQWVLPRYVTTRDERALWLREQFEAEKPKAERGWWNDVLDMALQRVDWRALADSMWAGRFDDHNAPDDDDDDDTEDE